MCMLMADECKYVLAESAAKRDGEEKVILLIPQYVVCSSCFSM